MNNYNIFDDLDKHAVAALEILSSGSYYLREIADHLKISPSAAHGALKKLLALKFVKISREKNKKIFSLRRDNLLLKKVMSILNLGRISSLKAFRALARIGTAGIYGSFAEGSNDEQSDLDLWVYAEKSDPAAVSGIAAMFAKELKIETNILRLNMEKLKNMKLKDPEFYTRLKYTSIYKGEAIFD